MRSCQPLGLQLGACALGQHCGAGGQPARGGARETELFRSAPSACFLGAGGGAVMPQALSRRGAPERRRQTARNLIALADGARRRQARQISRLAVLAVAASAASVATALDNGVARTPPMGWSSWNPFHANVIAMNEAAIRSQADALVASGLAAAGYRYVNLDDLWAAPARAPNSNLLADPHKFPSGMAALAAHLRNRSLLFGIYTDVGTATCGGQPGSYGHECQDAATFASWGVSWVKEDHCNLPPHVDTDAFYRSSLSKMRDCLNKTGRAIGFDLCAHGCYDNGSLHSPACWASWYGNATSIGNAWRTTTDIAVRNAGKPGRVWRSVLNNWYRNDAFHDTLALAPFAGPHHWNDPDSLVVGLPDALTPTQEKTHFSMWCVMASPLFLGNRLDTMTSATAAILGHRGLLAVNQDARGIQGRRTQREGSRTNFSDVYGDPLARWDVEVWCKPLVGGALALALVNHLAVPANVTALLSAVPPVFPGAVPSGTVFAAKELWSGASLGRVVAPGGCVAAVPVDPDGVAVILLTPL